MLAVWDDIRKALIVNSVPVIDIEQKNQLREAG